MTPVQTVLTAAVSTAVALSTGCAPPETQDYDAPDASYPEAAPRAVSVTPSLGAEDVNRRTVIRIGFDKEIDARTLQTGTVRLYSGPTGRWLTSYYDPFSRQIVLWPAGDMLRQSTWVVELREGLEGVNGLPAVPGTVTEFRTGDASVPEIPYALRSFESDILPIFQSRCTGCHGGPDALAGLRLDTAEGISETAISRPATGQPGWIRIDPTRPGLSHLLYKLTEEKSIPGRRMPRSLDDNDAPAPLCRTEKEALLDWIVTGAGFVDPTPSDT